MAEETDQVGRVVELVQVSHLHNPAAVGPEGYPIDWHGLRVLYRVAVDVPTEPRVTEAAGGSTARARWYTRAEVAGLRVARYTAEAVALPHD